MHWTSRFEAAAKWACRAGTEADEGGTTTARMNWEFGDVFRGKWLCLTPPYSSEYPDRTKKEEHTPNGEAHP